MTYSFHDLIAPYLPFISILLSTLFNYYIIIKKRLSWQGILIANVVFLSVMTLLGFPAYDFLSEIVVFLLDLIFKVFEALFINLWETAKDFGGFFGDIARDIWDWIKGIFS